MQNFKSCTNNSFIVYIYKDFLSKTVLVKDRTRNSHETHLAKKLNVIDPSNSHSMASFHKILVLSWNHPYHPRPTPLIYGTSKVRWDFPWPKEALNGMSHWSNHWVHTVCTMDKKYQVDWSFVGLSACFHFNIKKYF